MKLGATERVSLDTIQRKCQACGGWFYVESTLQRSYREGHNAHVAKHGGEFERAPALGRDCPDCAPKKKRAS